MNRQEQEEFDRTIKTLDLFLVAIAEAVNQTMQTNRPRRDDLVAYLKEELQ